MARSPSAWPSVQWSVQLEAQETMPADSGKLEADCELLGRKERIKVLFRPTEGASIWASEPISVPFLQRLRCQLLQTRAGGLAAQVLIFNHVADPAMSWSEDGVT